jgi:hypothetical protein
MSNLYRRFARLIPGQPVQAGQVAAVNADGCTVQLPTGDLVRVRGTATVGDHVYIKGGAIEGPAPALSGVDQDV